MVYKSRADHGRQLEHEPLWLSCICVWPVNGNPSAVLCMSTNSHRWMFTGIVAPMPKLRPYAMSSAVYASINKHKFRHVDLGTYMKLQRLGRSSTLTSQDPCRFFVPFAQKPFHCHQAARMQGFITLLALAGACVAPLTQGAMIPTRVSTSETVPRISNLLEQGAVAAPSPQLRQTNRKAIQIRNVIRSDPLYKRQQASPRAYPTCSDGPIAAVAVARYEGAEMVGGEVS